MDFATPDEIVPATEYVDIYRKMMSRVIAITILEQKGCTHISASCLDLLVELFQSILISIGSTARACAEHNGRVESNLQDILVAFDRVHISYNDLESYSRRPYRMLSYMPMKMHSVRPPVLLRVMPFQPHRSHIPNYLPPLPDSHTFRFTNAKQRIEPDYERLREKASTHKTQLSHALSRYLAKVSSSINLLGEDSPDSSFKVIKPTPMWPSYSNAIMPSDQHFDFEELEYFYATANSTWLQPKAPVCLYDNDQSDIDNPFLKEAKMPSASEEVAAWSSSVEHAMAID